MEPTNIQTIEQVEVALQKALESLAPSLPGNVRNYLAPANFKIVVELQEEGHKKSRGASSTNWKPETGEVFIHFERSMAANTESSVAAVPAGEVRTAATSKRFNPVPIRGESASQLLLRDRGPR